MPARLDARWVWARPDLVRAKHTAGSGRAPVSFGGQVTAEETVAADDDILASVWVRARTHTVALWEDTTAQLTALLSRTQQSPSQPTA
jgi:hypothetical protein